MSPAGLAPYARPAWLLMVDGLELPLDVLGVRNVDRLPFPWAEVDSVQILAGPGLHHGAPTDQGLIHVHTRRPTGGLSIHAGAHAGNSTGDPGPFEFTDPDARNVDRLGAGIFASVAYGSESFFARLAWTDIQSSATDPAVYARNVSLAAPRSTLNISIAAPSLSMGLDMDRSWHRLSVAGSRTEDLFLLPQLGREIPVLSHLRYASAAGGLEVGDVRSIRYRLTYTDNQLRRSPNPLDLDFDWRLRRWKGQVELAGWGRRGDGVVGAGLERRWAQTNYALTDDADVFTSVYAVIPLSERAGAPTASGLLIVSGDGDVGARVGVAKRWWLGGDRELSASVGYSRRLPEEEPGFWVWRARGYGFLEDRRVDVVQDGDLRTAWQATLDADVLTPIGSHATARLSGYLRTSGALALADQTFELDAGLIPRVDGVVSLATDLGGQTGGVQAELRTGLRADLELRSYYGYQGILGGDAGFRDAWKTVPSHRLRQTLDFTPTADFAMRADLVARSRTSWSMYGDEPSGGPATISHEVPATITLDLSLQKWLWNRRVWTHVVFRDVFDDDVGYHPIGASPGRALLAQLRFATANLRGG